MFDPHSRPRILLLVNSAGTLTWNLLDASHNQIQVRVDYIPGRNDGPYRIGFLDEPPAINAWGISVDILVVPVQKFGQLSDT